MVNVKTDLINFLVQKQLQVFCWKLHVYEKDNDKDFWLVRNLSREETHFNQFLKLRSQLDFLAEISKERKTGLQFRFPTYSMIMNKKRLTM